MLQSKIPLGLFLFIIIAFSQDSLHLEQCLDSLTKTFRHEFLQQYSVVMVASDSEVNLATLSPFRSSTVLALAEFIGHGSNTTTRALTAPHLNAPSLYLLCSTDISLLSVFFENFSSLIGSENDYTLRDRRHIILVLSAAHSMTQRLAKLLEEYEKIIQQDAFIYITEVNQGFQDNPKYYEIYHIKNTVKIFYELQGIEIPADLLRIEHRRSNMHQVFYNMVYQTHKDYVPWVLADDKGQVDKGIVAGYNLVTALVYAFNLTYSIIPGTGFIAMLPDGSLRGMGNQLLHFEADSTLNANELVLYRAKAFSYTQPILTNICEVFFQHLKLADMKNILVDAFQPQVWLAIGSVGLLISLSWLTIVTTSLAFDYQSFNENESVATYQLILLPIRLLCLQGMPKPPNKVALRVIFLSGLLLGTFLYVLYSSYILSIFTADPKILHTLYDFPLHGFELITQSRSLTAGGILKQLSLELTKREDGMPSVEMDTAIRQVQSSRTALVTTPNYYFSTTTNFSDLQLCAFRSRIKVPAITDRSVIFFRKNDPLRTFYNYKMIAMIERGFIYRTQKEFNEMLQKACQQTPDGVHVLSVSELHTAFDIFIFGVVLSVSFLVIERLVWRRQNIMRVPVIKLDYFLQ